VGSEVAEPVEVPLVAVEDLEVLEAFSVRAQVEVHGDQEPQSVTIPTAVEYITITVQVVAT
jgi:hypothetical protein